MKDSKLMKSVLGFDFNVEIKDQNGDVLKTGCRSCVKPKRKRKIVSKILDPNFFTHYNEALITKIRDMRNNNY
jgi:hypothetical protein